MTLPTPEQTDELIQDVIDAIEDAKNDDGKIDIQEAFGIFGVAVQGIAAVAGSLPGTTTDQKRGWFVDTIWRIWRDKVKFDIPVIPQPIDGMLQQGAMKAAASIIARFIWKD